VNLGRNGFKLYLYRYGFTLFAVNVLLEY